ncbi:hypothetical protein HGP28_02935 [Vibrio sp. SM6]|uniref:Antitoxin Xre/MbcA/ParS-like toxin-binding domain-containing protein n=1 Tax=Vibrio agarilyticus TaxID=2726741 RepID=A0A7X8YFR8_9VIBR|nr:hypothetical protein [Vibrio agarilyticus]NLS11845.1 hypothetical protein [Vibrio agarilyticus]
MSKSKQQASELLTAWGASSHQIDSILGNITDDNELQTRINLLFSISDCLQLLLRDETKRNGYMTTKNSGPYFDGRKPLDIIASGQLADLSDVHLRIRNMVCI